MKTYNASLLAMALSSLASLATATDATSGTAASSSNPDLQEVVVTATKSKEVISKVPISIVALTTEALEQSGVKSIADIGEVVPGVQFDQNAGLGAGTGTNISIRGINSTIGTSTTGIYLDDIPLQTRVASLSYWGNPYPAVFDLDRIEVERGPQGTLFGAGAEGGAVRFITPDPSLTNYSGLVHSEVADTEHGGLSYEGGAALGGPLIDNVLGFRFSVWDRHDGGYVDRVDPLTNTVVDSDSNTANTLATRLAVKYMPFDGLTITPAYFAQVARSNDSSVFYENMSDPSSGSFVNGRLSRQPNQDRLYLPSLKIEGDLPAGLTLTAVTGYMQRNGHGTQDTTAINGVSFGGYGYGVPEGGNPADYPQYWAFPTDPSQASTEAVSTNVKTFTQEVRLSNAADSRLKWTGGLFYSHAVQTDTQIVTAKWIVDNVINPFYGADLVDTDPLLFSQIRSTDEQLAGFGQVDFKATSKLILTLGGRVSHSTASYQQSQSGFLSSTGNGSVAVNNGSQSQLPWSGKAGLSYFVTDNDMVYLSASRGYRMGGANQPINSAPANEGGCGQQAPESFGEDKVNSYELGLKGKTGTGLHFDVDGYYVEWLNIQTSLYFPCQFGYIVNAGAAHSNGFDVDLSYDVTQALNVRAAVTYNHAYNVDTVYLPLSTAGTAGSLVVAAGDQLGGQGAAPWNATESIDYRFGVFGRMLRLHLEDIFKSHDSGQFPWMNALATLYQPALTANPSTNLLNGRLTLYFDRVDVALYANNILDAHPTLYRYQDTAASQLFTALSLRPRTIGVSVDYHIQ